MQRPKFYLVWKEGSNTNTPTYKHQSYNSAKTECERLTRENGGQFHVLCHMATATKNDILFEEVETIPF